MIIYLSFTDLQTGDLRLMLLDFVSLTLLQLLTHQNR